MILSIDPGDMQSAYCLIDEKTLKPIEFGKIDNHLLLIKLDELNYDKLIIEMIASYGMAVGKSVFETCVWIGRFIQRRKCAEYEYNDRKEEKINLCGSMKAKDSNIRQALIDRFAQHDFKNGKGKKSNPDFFYGVSKDVWSAFAVGITYLDKKKDE